MSSWRWEAAARRPGCLPASRSPAFARAWCAFSLTTSIKLDAHRVTGLAGRTARLLRRHGVAAEAPPPAGVTVETAWLGSGYGHPTSDGAAALELLGDREGVELEPVYTAKTAAGLLALNREGRFGDGPVLYWHTYRPAT